MNDFTIDSQKEKPAQFAQPQIHVPVKPVTIEELYAKRQVYENYPSYQRNQVASLRFNQWVINVLLAGKSIPSLIAYQEIDPRTGEQSFWITDGRQRLSAIYDFLDGKFKTWTAKQKEHAEPNSVSPIEPGKYFEELTPLAKRYLLNYIVNIQITPKRSDAEQREEFRGYQNHNLLSAAQKINTYTSRATEVARTIAQHPFWEDFYFGRDQGRDLIFQSSLHLLSIDIAPDGFSGVASPAHIERLAAGNKDHEITEQVERRMLRTLDTVCHLFRGSHFTIRASCIVMYQAVMFLERAHAPILEQDRGRLTPWFEGVITEANQTDLASPTNGYQRSIQRIQRKEVQRAFWARHMPIVRSYLQQEAYVS